MITRIHDEIICDGPLTGHQWAWASSLWLGVYDYDPAENGPECETITRIIASGSLEDDALGAYCDC